MLSLIQCKVSLVEEILVLRLYIKCPETTLTQALDLCVYVYVAYDANFTHFWLEIHQLNRPQMSRLETSVIPQLVFLSEPCFAHKMVRSTFFS